MDRLRSYQGTSLKKAVLGNGTALLVEPVHGWPLVAVRCYLRGGSIAEWPAGGKGVAHLAEHLFGTLAARRMEGAGRAALVRGLTSREVTCYHWTTLPEEAAASLRCFLETLLAPEGWRADLESQKQVVGEEIRHFQRDDFRTFQQTFVEEMFRVHPLRYPVCGSAAEVAALGEEDVQGYLERVYVGAQLVIAVAGDVEGEEVLDTAAAWAGRLPKGQSFELGAEADETAPAGPPFDVEVEELGEDPSLLIGFRTPGSDSPQALPLEALAQAINQPDHELRRELVDPGLAHDLAACFTATPYRAGSFYLWVHHPPGRAQEVEECFRGWFERAARGELTLPESAAESLPAAQLDLRATVRGEGEVLARDPHVEETARRRQKLRPQDVARALERCAGSGLTVGRIAQRVRERSAPRRPSSPEVWTSRLDNGVRILVLPTPSDQVSCQVMGRGGAIVESEATSGLSMLMTSLLPGTVRGSQARALEAFQERSGAEFFPFCDESFFGVSLTADRRGFLEGIDWLAEMVLRPAFRGAEMEERRRGTLAALGASSWRDVLRSHVKRLLFRTHPYRRRETGTASSLSRLTLDQVRACHREHCVGENLVLAVAGRVTPEEVGERLAGAFAAAPSGPAVPVPEAEPPGGGPRVAHCGGPPGLGALALGFSGIPWEARSADALDVLRTLLTGPEDDWVGGRLIRALRDAGLSYRCSCFQQAGFGDGYFALFAAFATDAEERAVAVVEGEIERLRGGGLTPDEVGYAARLRRLSRLSHVGSPRRQAYFAGRRALFSGELAAPEESSGEAPRAADVSAAVERFFRDDTKGLVLLRSGDPATIEPVEVAEEAIV